MSIEETNIKKVNLNKIKEKTKNNDKNNLNNILNNTNKKNNIAKVANLKEKEQTELISQNNYFHILGKILASPNKKKILYSLTIPLTPKEISKRTNLNFPTISKNIKELEELGVLKIKNKDLKKGKVIVIEDNAKTILYYLEKRKEEEKK